METAWVHIEADGTEVATVPGDYSLVEGGVMHADRCDSDVPCIGLLAFTGPRDVALAEWAAHARLGAHRLWRRAGPQRLGHRVRLEDRDTMCTPF